MLKQVLIAEDDPSLGFLLKENLENQGMQVTLCIDGQQAWDMFAIHHFSLCVIDVMMPQKDGLTLVKEIRKIDQTVPIIFLTARNFDEDKIKGFECGCDDYVTKPFSFKELMLRINALWRRVEPNMVNYSIQFGEFELHWINRQLSFQNETVKLSNKENELLLLLVKNKNKMIDRQHILQHIWGKDDYFTSRSMDVYIAKLRKLLKKDVRIDLQNIHGTGFRLIV